jgi:acyl carrier protein
MTQWLDYRTGELAAAAFVLAAAESRARTGGAAAQEAASNGIAWARQRYTGLARALDAELATQPPYSGSAALLRQVDSYADAIGDIEQQLPGEAHQLDAYLRHAPAAAAPAATPAPVFAAEATEPMAPDSVLALVHESVLKWLRSESRGSLPALDFDTPFSSIGIDSLAGASIAVDLDQHTGVSIAPELLFDYQTVKALAGYIAGRMAVQEAVTG